LKEREEDKKPKKNQQRRRALDILNTLGEKRS
jgi:hypothetical protein